MAEVGESWKQFKLTWERRGEAPRSIAKGAAEVGESWKQFKLTWERRGEAPRSIAKGAAVANGNLAYFSSEFSNDVVAYDSNKNDWSKLPVCPQSDFGLAVVNNLLTAVGGLSDKLVMPWNITNRLSTFSGSRWVTKFPPMPTKRHRLAVISAHAYLIAAGGWGEEGVPLSTVEVFDEYSLEWYTAASLPEPVCDTSATVCEGRLYLLGCWDKSNTVFTCTLESLIRSCYSGSPSPTSPHSSETIVWQRIADVPVEDSTCTTLNGKVLAVGGCDSHGIPTADVYIHHSDFNAWLLLGDVPTARSKCQVVGLGDCIITVGGEPHPMSFPTVEIGYLHLSGWELHTCSVCMTVV